MTLTSAQQEVTNDLVKFIQSQKIEINSPEDLQIAFRDYLINGSASHFYLQTADDHQKKQFRKQLTKTIGL